MLIADTVFSGSASAPDMKMIASLAHHSPIINKFGNPAC